MMRTAAVLLVVVAAACCGPKPDLVTMPSPHSRYDHNRTRRVRMTASSGESATPAAAASSAGTAHRFRKADYAPESRSPFAVAYEPPDESVDRLPAAQLVPAFTGLPLPISAAAVEGCPPPRCRSDRDDLVDFLATGLGAQAGVDSPSTQGDVVATAATYRSLLDLLAHRDLLVEKSAPRDKQLSELGVAFADRVLDARYVPAAIVDELVFQYKFFWFVLYRFPNEDAYTRLVVIPTDLRPDIKAKRP